MTRLGVYAAVSTALAGGVIVSAFHQRANFYSACVYLSQSNLCLMILINLILFIYGSLMYGLQRICYGPLRPIEIEQLYEKAWFAITETCLAMTIFREEVGAWFLVMFVALLTGKVWGWIGDGRVEVLEQQPPANPRLFHIRLSISLGMSVIYDLSLMSYTINTVIQQARPNMMVMFLFEFAVLTASSFATACRYGISLVEARVVKQQTQERLSERRREVREQRAEMIREREAATTAQGEGGASAAAQDVAPLPSEDDVDEMDIEVPGWEAKGQFVLSLDLMTDFVKLLIYITFFVILLVFYGLPIHIMRDLFMTGRSFAKRLSAFLKYRRATQDMNTKYEDATAEDILREDTCIICREEMRPWSVTNPPEPPAAPGAPGNPPRARPTGTVNERSRPKKLPCGHILHLGCLKSWLERQQACPTCRRPVVDPPAPARAGAQNNAAAPAGGVAPGQQNGPANPPAAPRAGAGMRMLNLGPIRLGFGQANMRDIAQGLGAHQQPAQGDAAAPVPRVYGLEFGFPRRQQQQQPQGQGTIDLTGANTWQEQIQQIEQGIVAEIRSLQVTQQELQLVQLLQTELARLRLMQTGAADSLASGFQMPQAPHGGAPLITRNPSPLPTAIPQVQRHGIHPNAAVIPAGSADLPPGVTIPEGWTLLPLQRLDESISGAHVTPSGNVSPAGPSTSSGASAPTAPTTQTQPQSAISPTIGGSNNNTLTPTAVQRTDNISQASSVDSSDTNAILTPLSNTADQPGSSAADTTLQMPVASSNPVESRNLNSSALNPPPTLPWWGSSELFSDPASSSRTDGTTNTDAGSGNRDLSREEAAPPLNAGPDAQTLREDRPSTTPADAAKSAWASERRSADGDAGESRREHKGKAKAVSVEDAEDEAEGA